MSDKDRFWDSLDSYRNILDSLPNPVIVTDMDKIVRYINIAARAIVPPPYEKMMNQPCCNFNTPYCHTADCCTNASCAMKKASFNAAPVIL